MKTSSNYGLKLMEGTDNVKRQDFVDNFTKIDTEMRVIENGGYPIVEATGTNSYTGSTARIKTLTKGTKLTLFVGADATGNCSLNLNGYGAKSIKDSNKNIVKNLKANVPYNLCYNGSDFILQGKGGGGNLIPKYLLAGYYGEGDNGRVDGAMVNRGAPTANLNCGGTYNLQEGYYSGGKIQVNSLAGQTPGNATAAQILSGYSAWVNGSKLTGTATIESLGGLSISYSGTNVFVSHDTSNRTVLMKKEDYDTSKSVLIIIDFIYKSNKYVGGTVFGLGYSDANNYTSGIFKIVTNTATSHHQNFIFSVGSSYGIQIYNNSSYDDESLNMKINYKIIYL